MLKDVISIKAKVDEKTKAIKGSWFYAMIELSMWAFASFCAYYYWYQHLSCFAFKFSFCIHDVLHPVVARQVPFPEAELHNLCKSWCTPSYPSQTSSLPQRLSSEFYNLCKSQPDEKAAPNIWLKNRIFYKQDNVWRQCNVDLLQDTQDWLLCEHRSWIWHTLAGKFL